MTSLRSSTRERLIKLAAEIREKKTYPAQVLALAPAFAVKSFGELPKGAIEASIEKRLLGDPTTAALRHARASVLGAPATPRGAWRRGAGRAMGGVAGLATAPLFFEGLKDLQSDDPNRKRIGAAKVVGSGTLFQFGKGGFEALMEGGRAGSLGGASRKALVNAAPSLMLAYGVTRKKKQEKPSYLAGAAMGTVGGALKGAIEGGLEGRSLSLNRNALGRLAAGRAAGRAAAGALGGLVLTGVLDKLVPKEKAAGFGDSVLRFLAGEGANRRQSAADLVNTSALTQREPVSRRAFMRRLGGTLAAESGVPEVASGALRSAKAGLVGVAGAQAAGAMGRRTFLKAAPLIAAQIPGVPKLQSATQAQHRLLRAAESVAGQGVPATTRPLTSKYKLFKAYGGLLSGGVRGIAPGVRSLLHATRDAALADRRVASVLLKAF